MSRKILPRFLAAVVLSVLAVSLSGCANDPLAEQYRSGSDKSYIAANGTITEIAPGDRGSAVRFAGTLEDGTPVSSAEYTGGIHGRNGERPWIG